MTKLNLLHCLPPRNWTGRLKVTAPQSQSCGWFSWKPDPTQATPPKVQEPACTSLSPRPGAPSRDGEGTTPRVPPKVRSSLERDVLQDHRREHVRWPGSAPRFMQAPSTQASPFARRRISSPASLSSLVFHSTHTRTHTLTRTHMLNDKAHPVTYLDTRSPLGTRLLGGRLLHMLTGTFTYPMNISYNMLPSNTHTHTLTHAYAQ